MTTPVPTPTAPSSGRRRRRRLRAVLLALGAASFVVIGGLVVALVTLRAWFPWERARDATQSALTDLLGVPARIGRLELDPLGGFLLEALCLGPPEGFQENWFCVERVEAAWRLRELAVDRLVVTHPRLVVEQRGDRTNLEAIASRLASADPPPPSEPLRIARDGPLSPLSFSLGEVAVRGLEVRVVGDGPRVEVGAIDLQLRGRIDPAALDAQARLELIAGPGPNVRLRRPDGLEVDARLVTTLSATVAAGAARGLTLERSGLEWTGTLVLVEARGGPLPAPVAGRTLRWSLPLWVAPREDRLTLGPVRFALEGRAPEATLESEIGVDGLRAALGALADPWGDNLGLEPQRGPGLVQLRGPSLHVDLDALADLLPALSPGTRVGGAIDVSVESVAGSVAELQAQRPRHVALAAALRGVRARRGAVELGGLDARLGAETGPDGAIALAGDATLVGLVQGATQVERARLTLDGAIGALPEPRLGATTMTATLAVEGLGAGLARVGSASAFLTLRGRDVFLTARAEEAGPVEVRARLSGEGVRTGTSGASLGAFGVQAEATLSNLLAPGAAPIRFDTTWTIDDFAASAARVGTGRLRARGQLDDPRLGRPLDASLSVELEAERIESPAARVPSLAVRADARAGGVPVGSARPLPATLEATLEVDLPRLILPEQGLELPLSLRVAVEGAPARERLRLGSLELVVARTIRLSASGRVADFLGSDPIVDLEANVPSVDLATLPLPRAVAKTLALKGRIGAQLAVAGRVAAVPRWLDRLDEPPIRARLEVRTASLGVQRTGEAPLMLRALTGRVAAALDARSVSSEADLRVAEVALPGRRIEGATLGFTAGLEGPRTRASGSWRVASIVEGGAPAFDLAGGFEVEHPLLGPVLVRDLRVDSAALGLSFEARGRLERRLYGALRPSLHAELGVDLGKVLALAAALQPERPAQDVSGRLSWSIDAESPSDRLIRVSSELGLQDLRVRGPGLELDGGSGLIPISQAILLPELAPRPIYGQQTPLDALGALAQEAAALQGDLARRSSIVVSATDVVQRSPRTADYESLRPFYLAGRGGHMQIQRVQFGAQTIEGLAADLSYRDGVFRLDRLGMHLLDGDVFGDVAVQVAGRDQLRARFRSTLTGLNFDIPARAARGLPPSGGDGSAYRGSGNVDLRVDLADRVMDGYFELSDLGPQALVTLVDALDPERKDADLQKTRGQLSLYLGGLGRYVVGIELSRANIAIRQNLMSLDFDWGTNFFSLWPLFRWNLAPVITKNIQGVQGYSLSFVLDQPWVRRLNESVFLGLLGGRPIVREDAIEAAPAQAQAR